MRVMTTSDGRKLPREALEAIRIRAVERVQAGESPEVVIKALGFHRGQIYDWLAAYREGGYEARAIALCCSVPSTLSFQ